MNSGINISGMVESCKEDDVGMCAKSVLEGFSAIDPTGGLALAASFISPQCKDIPETVPVDYAKAIEKLAKECVEVYDHCDYTGPSKMICKSMDSLSEIGFGDRISSLRISPGGISTRAVVFFEGDNLRGRHIPVGRILELPCLADVDVWGTSMDNMINSVVFDANYCFFVVFEISDKKSDMINVKVCLTDEGGFDINFRKVNLPQGVQIQKVMIISYFMAAPQFELRIIDKNNKQLDGFTGMTYSDKFPAIHDVNQAAANFAIGNGFLLFSLCWSY